MAGDAVSDKNVAGALRSGKVDVLKINLSELEALVGGCGAGKTHPTKTPHGAIACRVLTQTSNHMMKMYTLRS